MTAALRAYRSLTGRRPRRLVAGLAIAGLVTTGAAACTSDEPALIGPYELVFFDSCADALDGLRAATKAVVGPYGATGFGYGANPGWPVPTGVEPPQAGEDRDAPGMANGGADPQPAPEAPGAPTHSGTNVHESGVDEPDLVKTDGRRIVTVSDGRLSVVDVASRRLVGVVDLRSADGGPGVTWTGDLLLAGDHALVFASEGAYYPGVVREDTGAPPPVAVPAGVAERSGGEADAAPLPVPSPDKTLGDPSQWPVLGTSMVLVDLATPRILSRASADGSLVDARQVGSRVRLVLRSAPRLYFPTVAGSESERLTANRAVIDAAGIDAWAPRLEVTTGAETVRTQVGCDSISRPASYSGTNMLTVLTFDLTRDTLTDGIPVTVAADGDTVYSNGTSLYVASNLQWALPMRGLVDVVPEEPRTNIYRFDTTQERPRYVAGGSVPGSLLNQYSMSEWDGRLRVATTIDTTPQSHSGVYVLATDRGLLVQVGAVDGLGKGERIYAVRFVGPVGYVVTFRQTDPLYTVDLSNPTAPRVRGELKIPGYSAYLHPVGGTRLIGVGQDATDQGQTRGTQVSLFDVSNLDDPARLGRPYTFSGAYSEAEFDPHAFLYWAPTGLLVVPIEARSVAVPVDPPPVGEDGAKPTADQPLASGPLVGALVLRLANDEITEVGLITHPTSPVSGYVLPIRRSLITTDAAGHVTLWTVSDGGLMATDPDNIHGPGDWIAL